MRDRLEGLTDEPRPGGPRKITDAQVEEVVVKTLEGHTEGRRALVLCVDEKTQLQALDRSAPVLPMMPGMPESHPPTTMCAVASPTCSQR